MPKSDTIPTVLAQSNVKHITTWNVEQENVCMCFFLYFYIYFKGRSNSILIEKDVQLIFTGIIQIVSLKKPTQHLVQTRPNV